MNRSDSEGPEHQAPKNQLAEFGYQSVTKAEYAAAIAEFDHLWETGVGKRAPEQMKRLLAVIESFEKMTGYNS